MADEEQQRMAYMAPQTGLNADFFERATNMSQELFEFDMLLAGKMISEKGEWVDDPNRQPLLNDKGRAVIKTILATALNKNTYMSDLRAERVAKLVYETSEDIQTALFFNRIVYGIKDNDIGIYEYIISLIENMLETAFARPIDGRERNMYNTMVSETSHRILEQRNDGGGSWLSGILQKPKSKWG